MGKWRARGVKICRTQNNLTKSFIKIKIEPGWMCGVSQDPVSGCQASRMAIAIGAAHIDTIIIAAR